MTTPTHWTPTQRALIESREEAERFAAACRKFGWEQLELLKEALTRRWWVCPTHGQRAENGVDGSGLCRQKVSKTERCGEACARTGNLKAPAKDQIAGSKTLAANGVTIPIALNAMGLGPQRTTIIDNRKVEMHNGLPLEVFDSLSEATKDEIVRKSAARKLLPQGAEGAVQASPFLSDKSPTRGGSPSRPDRAEARPEPPTPVAVL